MSFHNNQEVSVTSLPLFDRLSYHIFSMTYVQEVSAALPHIVS